MKPSNRLQPDSLTEDQQAMLSDVIAGLRQEHKSIPSKYFYDEAGSRIFDEITELPEYYPTRTEAEIMRLHGAEMAGALGEGVMLIEYGSGSSIKTRILLDHLDQPAAYVPVDISGDYLFQVADNLRQDYPDIPVLPVVADFTQSFELPEPQDPAHRPVVYFPGSTIGNFTRSEAVEILAGMATLCDKRGGVLIGVDLLKPTDMLLAAYNDSQDVTARFNLNLLCRLNSELDSDFDVDQFRHEAVFNEAESRIEMHLLSDRRQEVCVDGIRFQFEKGESILTEYSHKYTPEAFTELAAGAGLETQQIWTDPKNLFSVQYLTPTR